MWWYRLHAPLFFMWPKRKSLGRERADFCAEGDGQETTQEEDRLTTWYLYMRSDSEALSWPLPSQFTPSSVKLFFSCLDRITSTTPAPIFRGFLHSLADDISRRMIPETHAPTCCSSEGCIRMDIHENTRRFSFPHAAGFTTIASCAAC